MKKLLAILLVAMFATLPAFGQGSSTTMGFTWPAHGTKGWDTSYIANWNLLDASFPTTDCEYVSWNLTGKTYYCSAKETKKRAISFTFIDGTALTTGLTRYQPVPFGCSIVGWNILVDAGTATVKVWKKATGTAIPTVSDSISTSGLAISTGTNLKSTTLSDFTATTVTAWDIVAVNITAVATAKYLNFTMECDQ
jgi:hypothetical protein